MKTKKLKVADLSGAALDWAVAKVMGFAVQPSGRGLLVSNRNYFGCWGWTSFFPSSSWADGGRIVERLMLDGMLLEAVDHDYRKSMPAFKATLTRWMTLSRADTVLNAAMRCYVASKLGDEVDVPEALL